MVSHVAVIVGISGKEFVLDRALRIAEERKKAKTFRSERAAHEAAQQHIAAQAPCVARGMAYRVEGA